MKPRAVHLLSVKLDGYRSCKNTSFALSTHVSALIGLNGSGKTNILHGLRLLRAVGRLRGRASAVLSRCRVKAEYRVNGKRVRYRALVTVGQDLRGREEVIRARELWNFKKLTGVDSWIDLPSRFIRDPYYFSLARRRTGLKQRHAAYWMPERDIKRSPLPRRVLAAVQRIASFNATITYYSVAQFTDPSRSPTSFELDSDGDLRTTQPGEHTTFLHGLHQTYKNDRQEYEDFISLVGPKGIGLIQGIEWKEIIVKSRDVRVRSGGQVVSEPQRRTIVIPLVSQSSGRTGSPGTA